MRLILYTLKARVLPHNGCTAVNAIPITRYPTDNTRKHQALQWKTELRADTVLYTTLIKV